MSRIFEGYNSKQSYYVLSRAYSYIDENSSFHCGIFEDIKNNIDKEHLIIVTPKEMENVHFYTNGELEKLVGSSKVSIEVTGKSLVAGDLVIGYTSFIWSTHLYIGLYLGRKQIFYIKEDGTVDKKSCQLVYKISDKYMTKEDVEIKEKLILSYRQYEDEKLQAKMSIKDRIDYKVGDLVTNNASSIYWFLGQKSVDTKISYVYVRFSIQTRAQIAFFEFLKSSTTCGILLSNLKLEAKLSLYDMSLKSIILILINSCNGNIISSPNLKLFNEYKGNVNLDMFLDDVEFIKKANKETFVCSKKKI